MGVYYEDAREVYKIVSGKKTLFLFLFALACMLVFIADVSVGPAWLPIKSVFLGMFAPESVDKTTRIIIWTIRLPTVMMATVVGAALGIAGVEMQTILNNPLASPYTLGVSAGAGFGAALALVLGVGVVPHAGEFFVPANAFLFALLTSMVIYFIAKIKGATTETMVLAGIALLFLFHSMLALLEYIASEEALQAVAFWLFGSLLKATWVKVEITSVILLLVALLLMKDAWRLTALRLGDERAKSLGINVEELRLRILILISLLTAVAVCFVGTIGFVGLVGPHMARMLIGEDQRYLLPMSALGGAFILLAAWLCSNVVPGAIFPIGIVTSFVGVPFFIFLILRRRRGFW